MLPYAPKGLANLSDDDRLPGSDALAFLVLSTTPGYEIKPLAMGIAAGIIFDATVIRALLVPALMRLRGEANWWMPNWTRVALRIPVPESEPPLVPERVG
jgi:hypothetical protein